MVSMKDLLFFLKSSNLAYQVYLPSGIDDEKIVFEGAYSNSKDVTENSLFCCIPGEKADGHDFVDDVVRNGCSAVLCERRVLEDIPQILVPSVRETMGFISSFIYGNPSSKLLMLAVTGTNGKSTTTYMIKSLLDQAGVKTGLLGTIVYDNGHDVVLADRTTPESCFIQKNISAMVKNGCKACVMEASSHGLVQGRLNGCLFDIGVFTNITPEHLDYHGTIENYYMAKRRLFANYMKEEWKGAVNLDDQFGKKLVDTFGGRITGYGLECSNNGNTVTAKDLRMSLEGLDFDLLLPCNKMIEDVRVPLTGKYNVYNVLGSICAVLSFKIKPEVIRRALATMPQVPGRLEKYLFANNVCCIIDYAHTPDALKNVLVALKGVSTGRIRLVFGLGGHRFSENRQVMGRIAAKLADYITVTMDNPRDEDPADIADQIVEGIVSADVTTPPEYQVIIDRKEAVRSTLEAAESSDIVLITGKGPERCIIWGDRRIPYNDGENVRAWAGSKKLEWR